MLKYFGLLILWSSLCASSDVDSVDRRLYDYLFTNYSADIRPIMGNNSNEQIVVSFQFYLSQLEELNEKDEQLTTHGTMLMYWTDQLLTWDPAEYNGANFLIVPASKIWLPEVVAMNSVIDADELAYDQSNVRVRIFFHGLVIWAPAMRLKTTCPVEIAAFPYDDQECLILYGNFVYTSALVNFTVSESVGNSVTNGSGWALLETKAEYSEFIDDYYTYPVLEITLKLRRNYRYFELNIVLPAILLSLLLIPMFILPVDSGEKVSLGVTLMLAYSIFLLMLTEYTPQSGSIPRLSVVLVVCIVFSGTGIFVNVLIINIHHHMPDKTVPKWVKRFLIGAVGTMICRMRYARVEEASQVEPEPMFTKKKEIAEMKNIAMRKMVISDEMAQLLAYLEFFKIKRLEDEQSEQNKEDWNKVARVLDRIFLIVYVILFVVYLFITLSYKWRAN